MLMMLVPNWVNSASTKRWMPSPIEVSRITAAIPTAMPEAERKVRSRCAVSACRAKRRVSAALIQAPSFSAQRPHGIEPRRAHGGQQAGDGAGEECSGDARHAGPGGRPGGEHRVGEA